MNLPSLNVDVLLYLLKFVDAVDCFNLALSGILKGFENIHKGVNLQNRYSEHFTCNLSGNQFVTCPESNIVKLNWDYVGMACAS
jgi:hypothetical protein